ncbi:MAG TPA: nucleoside deaminase [Polyangia bacterium]|nr:nucleoside deaminase [Polyangia bacterium]
MRSDDERFLEEAFALAREGMADGRGGPFGAVVVQGGAIVARGNNRVVRDGDPTAHAEVVAIREACLALGTHVLDGCVLYSSCEPCPMCLAAGYWSRIGRVVYAATHADAAAAGFDDTLIYGQIVLAPGERSLRMEQKLRTEGVRLFDEWLANPERVPY